MYMLLIPWNKQELLFRFAQLSGVDCMQFQQCILIRYSLVIHVCIYVLRLALIQVIHFGSCTRIKQAKIQYYVRSYVPLLSVTYIIFFPLPLSVVGQSLDQADGSEKRSEGHQAHRPKLPEDAGERHSSWHPCVAGGGGGDTGPLSGTCPAETDICTGKHCMWLPMTECQYLHLM